MTVQQLSINHRYRDTRPRGAALLMLGRKITSKVIAGQRGVSERGVYNWSHTWRDSGLRGPTGGHNGGCPPASSDAIIATALDVPRTESLRRAQIGQRVQAIYGESLTSRIETFGEALKREGSSLQRKRHALKERNEEEFQLKADTLGKLEWAARDGRCCGFYFAEAGFHAAPPVQRSWSRWILPCSIEPNSHCKRGVVYALCFGKSRFIYAASVRTVKGLDVIESLDSLSRRGDGRPTVIVLDNASIPHSIDQDALDHWFPEHRALLLYRSPYSPELNLFEIVWTHFKYHWRRFVTWTQETIRAERAALPRRYGTGLQVNFS